MPPGMITIQKRKTKGVSEFLGMVFEVQFAMRELKQGMRLLGYGFFLNQNLVSRCDMGKKWSLYGDL
ncbi:unnamed protein product [Camellia sinensis]